METCRLGDKQQGLANYNRTELSLLVMQLREPGSSAPLSSNPSALASPLLRETAADAVTRF